MSCTRFGVRPRSTQDLNCLDIIHLSARHYGLLLLLLLLPTHPGKVSGHTGSI